MTEFEACVSQLELLLAAENAALSNMDVDAIGALAAEKQRLVTKLRDLRPVLDDEQVSAIMATQLRRLSRTCDDNKALLERAMMVHRRLMGVVVAATRPPVTGYGRQGAAVIGTRIEARAITARA